MISKWRYLLKNWSFEWVDNTFAAILKSQGLFMTVQIERVTLHSWSSMFLFYFSTDLIRITITSESNEIMKILPSQLQRVNMSHSNFFQLDLLAVFVIKVGSHNAMFYDVVLRQRDRLLCSVQKKNRKEKNTYKNTKYLFYVFYRRWVFTCFMNINVFELCFWYNEVPQLPVLIMIIFSSPWTSFTNKYREGNIFSNL